MATPAIESKSSLTSGIVKNDKPVKAIDDKIGAQLTRSGQQLDTSFVDAIVSAYSNLSNAPTICFIFIATVALSIAEHAGIKQGPLEVFAQNIKSIIDSDISNLLRSILKIFLAIISIVIKYKSWLIDCVTLSVPAMMKPSSKNLKITAVLLVCAIAFDGKPLIVLLGAQAWFLMTELRNPKYKFSLAIMVGVVIFFSLIENIDGNPAANFNSSSLEAKQRPVNIPDVPTSTTLPTPTATQLSADNLKFLTETPPTLDEVKTYIKDFPEHVRNTIYNRPLKYEDVYTLNYSQFEYLANHGFIDRDTILKVLHALISKHPGKVDRKKVHRFSQLSKTIRKFLKDEGNNSSSIDSLIK